MRNVRARRVSPLCLSALSFVLCAIAFFYAAPAEAQVRLRLSFKLIWDDSVSPSVRPGSKGLAFAQHCQVPSLAESPFSCEEEIRDKVAHLNGVLDRMGRGIRLEVVEVVDIVDPPDPPAGFGASSWSNAPDLGAVEDDLTEAALADKATWMWREDAVNYYIFNTVGGGYADNLRWGGQHKAVTTGQGDKGAWSRILHELGHYLGLFHTFGHNDIPRDDVCDTIVDNKSGTIDDIAQDYFSESSYAGMTDCAEQEQVLDVWFNIMSYHADDDHELDCRSFDYDSVRCDAPIDPQICRHRLSNDQLDRIAVRLNSLQRMGIAVGRTLWVDQSPAPACDFTGCNDLAQSCPHEPSSPECPCTQAPRLADSTPFAAYSTLSDVLTESECTSTEEVVVIRGGSYAESPMIDHPVTLSGGGSGDAVIGD